MAKDVRTKTSQEPLDAGLRKGRNGREAELERRVVELEKRVALLEQCSPLPVFANQSNDVLEERKPGPKERISEQVLVHYRDGLILWLEKFWPWLENQLQPVPHADRVRAIFEAIADPTGLRPAWQERLLDNAPVLYEFLLNERFKKRALPKATVAEALDMDADEESRYRAANQFPSRQIANAMAGVPDISWRRSLDRCSAQPSIDYVAMHLDMHYRQAYGIAMPKDRNFEGVMSPLPQSLKGN